MRFALRVRPVRVACVFWPSCAGAAKTIGTTSKLSYQSRIVHSKEERTTDGLPGVLGAEAITLLICFPATGPAHSFGRKGAALDRKVRPDVPARSKHSQGHAEKMCRPVLRSLDDCSRMRAKQHGETSQQRLDKRRPDQFYLTLRRT